MASQSQASDLLDFLTVNYGVYDLMAIVNLDGEITATNSVDFNGDPIQSRSLIGQNVSDTDWFQVVSSGQTPEGGTYYTDIERSSLVAAVYDDDRITLPFSAPIYDATGRMVAVWHNQASFDRIAGEVLSAKLSALQSEGLTTAAGRLTRSDGLVLLSPHPDEALQANLADSTSSDADVVGQSQGSVDSLVHVDRAGNEVIAGYAVSSGALGFDGYGWTSLMQVDVAEATAAGTSIRNAILGVIAAIAVAAFV